MSPARPREAINRGVSKARPAVLLAWRATDHIAGSDFDRRLAPTLCQTEARGHDQDLTQGVLIFIIPAAVSHPPLSRWSPTPCATRGNSRACMSLRRP